jgi:pimeloyl-ACP methyl ester carboxylesterase
VRTSEGIRLRTILTRPVGARKRLPAVFLTQWVSCGSIDFAADGPGLLRDIALQSGMVLIRVERAGTGDSEGPACSALDYDTEVRHYREAFDQLARHPWLDRERILIFGSSLGAITAPLVAEGKKVAGIVVQGGGAVSYVERMINFDRLYLERSGRYSPDQIHGEMLKRIAFHVEYLLGAKTPEQVAKERPDLAGVWQSIRGGAEAPPHYGRPYSWHWQAARTDFLKAWTKVEAPVLVVYGEYDQFEPRHGHELIADTLNRLRPGSATFLEVPSADHDMDLYASAVDAYGYKSPTVKRDLLVRPLLDWARKVTAR